MAVRCCGAREQVVRRSMTLNSMSTQKQVCLGDVYFTTPPFLHLLCMFTYR